MDMRDYPRDILLYHTTFHADAEFYIGDEVAFVPAFGLYLAYDRGDFGFFESKTSWAPGGGLGVGVAWAVATNVDLRWDLRAALFVPADDTWCNALFGVTWCPAF